MVVIRGCDVFVRCGKKGNVGIVEHKGGSIADISDVQMQPMTEKPIKNILRPEP